MTKITLSPQNFRIQKQETTLLKEKSTEKNSLAKSILAVKNHFIELRSKLSERFISHKNTESSATHFHRGSASEGRAVLTNKVVKDFMLQTLNDIDIRGSASKDPHTPARPVKLYYRQFTARIKISVVICSSAKGST